MTKYLKNVLKSWKIAANEHICAVPYLFIYSCGKVAKAAFKSASKNSHTPDRIRQF